MQTTNEMKAPTVSLASPGRLTSTLGKTHILETVNRQLGGSIITNSDGIVGQDPQDTIGFGQGGAMDGGTEIIDKDGKRGTT